MRRGGILVAVLALLAALPSLLNGFVYDDVPAILQNPLVHALGKSPEIWHSSYWPIGQLYRPLTIQLFALEWAVGGGGALVFHVVSVLLAAVNALLLFRLASRLLTPVAAAGAAAIFALHPAHVEAVANLVGQAELLATLFALLAVERYLVWREAGELSSAKRLLLAALTLLAILSKETGYVVPLLLAAAELTVVRRPRARLREVFLLQAGAVAAALLIRVIVLGSLAGENPANVLRGLGLGPRFLVMLAVAPQWLRLLLWPAHLQAEYGPPAIPVSPPITGVHLLGLLVLLGVIALCVRSWRRQPVIALGLLWVLLSLAPVSNLLAPSGILLAERVMYLPSAGLALALGGGLAVLLPRWSAAPGPLRLAAGAAAILLLALAAARAMSRNSVWRSQEQFFPALLRDAPGSYWAHLVASRYFYGERRFPEAERAARSALALYPFDVQVHERLGQTLRVQGRCAEALPILASGVRLEPGGVTVRSRLIECALAVGDTDRARAAATDAVRLGQTEFRATLQRLSSPPGQRSP